MKTTVVCESWFGNTRRIAEEIAESLDAELLSLNATLPDLDELDLLVVGAPTHVHGLSSTRSRDSAVEQSASVNGTSIGMRDWLEELPHVENIPAAAFDTRFEKPVLLTGSAAKGIARRLQRRGFRLIAPPESFFVLGTAGPLKDGELDRAAAWAENVSSATRESAGRLAMTAPPA